MPGFLNVFRHSIALSYINRRQISTISDGLGILIKNVSRDLLKFNVVTFVMYYVLLVRTCSSPQETLIKIKKNVLITYCFAEYSYIFVCFWNLVLFLQFSHSRCHRKQASLWDQVTKHSKGVSRKLNHIMFFCPRERLPRL